MRPRLATTLAAAALVAACARVDRPVDPVWGKQKCDSCAMILSESRPAAELTTRDGERLFFDDPGCMATYVDERHPAIGGAWVRSDAATWVDARAARFATGERTPMDFGFLASPAGSAAWDDVVRAARARRERGESR